MPQVFPKSSNVQSDGCRQSLFGTPESKSVPRFQFGCLISSKLLWSSIRWLGAVAGLAGIECGVVSGVINLESSGVERSDWRPRYDKHYLIGPHRVAQVEC